MRITQLKEIHYGWTLWFLLVHVCGVVGVWYACTYAHAETIVTAIVLYLLCHLSITCGAHRLYAHVSYNASAALQYMLLFFFSAVGQGPMAWWVGKHRMHHHQTDTALDPHSPRFGFFWSHVGWMCTKAGIQSAAPAYMKFGKSEKKYVLWQYKNHWLLTVVSGLLLPVMFCGILWNDWLGGILVVVAARLLFQYHGTWIVNSLCHMYGQCVTGGGTARNIPFLGLITVGESFHANHHQNETSWMLGSQWYDLDVGKWVIWFCIKCGLASEMRTSTQ